MKTEWEAMTIDELFVLREQMHELLSAKLTAKKLQLEQRLHALNQRSKVLGTVEPSVQKLLVMFGHCGCAWKLLPLLSSL